MTVPPGSTCGVLSVPETRGIEGTPTVRLPYVVVPGAHGEDTVPPVVVLLGSTAFADLDVLGLTTTLGLSTDRDVVFVERRGGASAKPALRCAAAMDVLSDVFAEPTSRKAAVSRMTDAVEGCAKRWAADGLTVASFGVEQAANDLIELRRELRYPSWFVYASGTAAPVAARAAAIDPKGVSGVVLDAPVFDGGNRRPSTGLGSAAALASAVAAADRAPHRVPGWRPVVLNGDTLEAVVDAAAADPARQAALPLALATIANGGTSALDAIVEPAVSTIITPDVISRWLATCAAPYRPVAVDGTGTTLLADLTAASCAGAGIPITPQADAAVLAGEHPTLILDEGGTAAADSVESLSFPAADRSTFPGAGSPILTTSSCGSLVVRAWLADPSSFRSGLCAADDAAVRVLAAADTHPSPRLAAAVASAPAQSAAVFAVPVVFGVVNLFWAIGWLVPTIGAILRRQPVLGRLATGIAPMFGSVWFIGCAVAVIQNVHSSPATVLLGVPAAVPWLSIMLVLGGFGLTPVWQRAPRGRRLAVFVLSALWAATAAWVVWFVFGWA